MKILIDNGHGVNTRGKSSPDGRIKEYRYCREIASRLVKELRALGHDAELVVAEEADIALGERCNRVNAVCDVYGKERVLLVSIHLNAAGSDGRWHEASGWTCWVARTAGAQSRRLAQILQAKAAKRELLGNRFIPPTKYWTENYKILTGTRCAAVLTENMFQDNEGDVDFLLTEEGKQAIVALHKEGIIDYINEYEGQG